MAAVRIQPAAAWTSIITKTIVGRVAHARSCTNLVVHLVWSTRHRRSLLPVEVDAWLANRLACQAEALGCEVLAVGNASEHVHMLVRLAATASVSLLAGRLKGATSRAWHLEFPSAELAWQDGYWAESCDPRDLSGLIRYIQGQRIHHASATMHEPWQRDDE